MDEQHESDPVGTADQTPDNSVMDSILPPVKPKHVLAGLLKIAFIVILVALIIVGGIWFFTRHKAAAPAVSTKTSSTSATSTSATKITSATKHYDSTNYNLGFDYPSDWTISDQDSAKLTATSPDLQLEGVNGDTFTGKIIFSVQNQQTSIADFTNKQPVASMESQKIAYKKPTPNQRAQTYVTFVNYAGTAGLIDALYITGDNGYQSDQNVPQSDVIQANPLVTVSFQKCADASCSGTATAGEILTKSWSDTSLSKPIINLLESLAIE